MIHLLDVAEQLSLSPEQLIQICQILGIEIANQTISAEAEQNLFALATAAERENTTVLQAAQKLASARSAQQQASSKGERFSLRDFFQKRFGSDPEKLPANSLYGVMYRQLGATATQIGDVGANFVIEAALMTVRDRLQHGTEESDNSAIQGSQEAQTRILEAISTDFLTVNWGEENHPALLGSSTSGKQLSGV